MSSTRQAPHDVVVVGGGPAGIGVAIALKDAGISDLVVLERNVVASSFIQWPDETRFITPSFPTNSVGMLDLNSIAIGVSPAWSLEVEHPNGVEYAEHLQAVASAFEVPVREGCAVRSVRHEGDHLFCVETEHGEVWAKHVVWAVGEYQYPRVFAFPGASACCHTATIDAYASLEGDHFVIIGGYESGIDAAYHLAMRGLHSVVVDQGCPWADDSPDPSISLSTYTTERIRDPRFEEHVELYPHTTIAAVEEYDGVYHVVTDEGERFETSEQPLLAAGFVGGHQRVADLFAQRDDGYPLLSKDDESTVAPGLFLCGPSVRHGDQVFCFIYKYRQRFAVVAKAVATSLGLPAEELENYRAWGMYLDDLTICGQDCVC